MINVPYHASRWRASWNRRRFTERLPHLPAIRSWRDVPATVYSFSGERDWPEQAASIRSFLRFVGTPRRFLVVSDGSHSEGTIRSLQGLNLAVSVVSLDSVRKPDLPAKVREYGAAHALGRTLQLMLSIAADGATIYSDSDVLFFPGAHGLSDLLQGSLQAPRYLQDCWPSLDSRLIAAESEKQEPVNSGFLIFDRPLCWGAALERLERLEGDCGYFTEQTLVHLAMKASGGQPLPESQYILRAEDQFAFGDHYAKRGIALRHYISSIRTKFWHQVSCFE